MSIYFLVNNPKILLVKIFCKKKMAPKVGLEPTTNRLTAGCSTTELLRNDHKYHFTYIYYYTDISKIYKLFIEFPYKMERSKMFTTK